MWPLQDPSTLEVDSDHPLQIQDKTQRIIEVRTYSHYDPLQVSLRYHRTFLNLLELHIMTKISHMYALAAAISSVALSGVREEAAVRPTLMTCAKAPDSISCGRYCGWSTNSCTTLSAQYLTSSSFAAKHFASRRPIPASRACSWNVAKNIQQDQQKQHTSLVTLSQTNIDSEPKRRIE